MARDAHRTSTKLRLLRASVLLGALALVAGACSGSSFRPGDSTAGSSGTASGFGGSSGNVSAGGAGKASGGESGKGASGNAGEPGSGGSGKGGAESGAGGRSGSEGGGSSGTGGGPASGAGGGGTGGGAGSSGSGGLAGGAGSSGSGGLAGGAECSTADDCVRVTDCCSCTAEPKTVSRPTCDRACAEDACFSMGILPEQVTCAFGRCVFDLSCDVNEALCSEAPPSCAAGLVPSVRDPCWGPCLPPTECRSVTSCDACTAVDAACVRFELQLFSIGCVAPGTCQKGELCECLDACSGVSCSEDEGTVSCFCPAC